MIKELLALQSVFLLSVIKCFVPLASYHPPPQPPFEDEAGIIEKGKQFLHETLQSASGG